MTKQETIQALAQETTPCPLCNHPSKAFRRGVREDPDRPVFVCSHCFLQFIDPPTHDLREFYREKYRAQYDIDPARKLTPEQRFLVMRPLMRDAASRFKAAVPKGSSVLEIGCSSGYFLDALGDGYDRFGAEWNEEDAAFVRDVGELPCEEGALTDIYPGQQFTAIAALQVLEHQPDPVQFLKDCKERLIGGGYLYLELPSSMDALNTVYNIKEHRDFWYREPHITYWTRETLASVLGQVGLEAEVMFAQRYGLLNHLNWLLNRAPMRDAQAAQSILQPVMDDHPMSAVMNRHIGRLDQEYRVMLISYGCADTIAAVVRRREI
tara:strand:+ start:4022 stop:4990 length:969 start_codon:yes stop_codon:yes gene_type:complete